jgi:hypothetical protein
LQSFFLQGGPFESKMTSFSIILEGLFFYHLWPSSELQKRERKRMPQE